MSQCTPLALTGTISSPAGIISGKSGTFSGMELISALTKVTEFKHIIFADKQVFWFDVWKREYRD